MKNLKLYFTIHLIDFNSYSNFPATSSIIRIEHFNLIYWNKVIMLQAFLESPHLETYKLNFYMKENLFNYQPYWQLQWRIYKYEELISYLKIKVFKLATVYFSVIYIFFSLILRILSSNYGKCNSENINYFSRIYFIII